MGPVLFYCVTVSAAVGCIYFLLFSLFHRREKALEGKSKVSHSVHSPYFTDDKQEFWWCYISDRKNHALITPPIHVTGLVEREEVELKFTAPAKPGKFVHNLFNCKSWFVPPYTFESILVMQIQSHLGLKAIKVKV